MADLYIALEEANAKAMELEAERDQLRAELAAAKERGDGLYLGLRQTLEALGGVAQPGVSEAFLILGVPGEAAALKRVNTALAADNARLRSVLVWLDRIGGLGLQVHARITEALAATPAHPLAAHDAALLREVAVEIDALGAGPDIDTVPTRLEDIANGIRAKADRIAKEAPHA